jgi:hypothetical protein
MAKGKKHEKKGHGRGITDANDYMDGGRAEEYSEEEVESNVDSIAATTKSNDLSEEFPNSVDNLTDNAGSKRIKALLDILKNLKSGVDLSDYVLTYREDIILGIVWILRRHQTESECTLAMQLACIYALVVGADDDAYYHSLQEALKFAATRSTNEEIRRWAVTSLAFISYICSGDINVDVWTFCGDVLCKESEAEDVTPAVQAAAAGEGLYAMLC